jgi:ribose-phosphate pyrophosphokinase
MHSLTGIAVMPYFPYSRQSKKKSHRGAIAARMIANLLNVAGVDHVITIDLHATQMQGFFECPVDNLPAEPLLARWIKHNVGDWQDGVVVSKNPGGTKRATSLADRLKLNFGIVTTESRRPAFLDLRASGTFENSDDQGSKASSEATTSPQYGSEKASPPARPMIWRRATTNVLAGTNSQERQFSPIAQPAFADSPQDASPSPLVRSRTEPLAPLSLGAAYDEDEYVDEVRPS